MNSTNVIEFIQEWYLSHCDGDWEHDWGLKINTLDNPGWQILINLDGTELETAAKNEIRIERNEKDWIFCFVRNKNFEIACGPANLSEALIIFMNWVQNNGNFH